MTAEPAARVYRGKGIEAEHAAVVAVVDASSNLTHYLGDPTAAFMARSSIKPFQALPLDLTGGLERFGFNARHRALMCASHNGEDVHRDLALEILTRIGASQEHLHCGAHRPLGMEIRGEFPHHGEEADPLRSDCSGKHAGFLALARHLDEPLEDYLSPDGPVQRLVREAVAGCCECRAEQLPVAIDGCSAPNFAIPLTNLAIGFKNLALARADDPATAAALCATREAMTGYPELVAGEGRFDTAFMREFGGRAVCKLGAEAIRGIGFVDPPVGIAVKILDGAWRALEPVCLEVLAQLGLLEEPDEESPLHRWRRPLVRNVRGIVTGRIEVDFEMRKA